MYVWNMVLYVVLVFTQGVSILRCAQESKPKAARFYFVAACTQSSMKVIATRHLDSLQACKQFAIRYRGFAVNFVHQDFLHKAVRNYSGPTCLVYNCPEFEVLDSVDRNTVFDYYSTYARPLPKTNVSCIPRVGVFQLHREKKNFTEALELCEEEGGFLADVTSELYTKQISSLIASLNVTEAYVGLDQIQNPGQFLTYQGLPLNCIKYRAWAPGEPKPVSGEKCALVTSKEQWKAVLCKRRFPFICEMHPFGPFRPCRKIRNRRRREKCAKRFRKTFPSDERRPRCGDPSVTYDYEDTYTQNNSDEARGRNGTVDPHGRNNEKNTTKEYGERHDKRKKHRRPMNRGEDGYEDNRRNENRGREDGYEDNRRTVNREGEDGYEDNRRTVNREGKDGYETNRRTENRKGEDGYEDNRRTVNREKEDGYEENRRTVSRDGEDGYEENRRTVNREGEDGYEDNRRAVNREREDGYENNRRTVNREGENGYENDRRTRNREGDEENQRTVNREKEDGYEENRRTASRDGKDGYEENRRTVNREGEDGYEDNRRAVNREREDGYENNRRTVNREGEDGYENNRRTVNREGKNGYEDNRRTLNREEEDGYEDNRRGKNGYEDNRRTLNREEEEDGYEDNRRAVNREREDGYEENRRTVNREGEDGYEDN